MSVGTEIGWEQALAAARADGYVLLDERVVLRFALILAFPESSPYRQAQLLRYASRTWEHTRGERRTRPTPKTFHLDPASAKTVRALVARWVAEAHPGV